MMDHTVQKIGDKSQDHWAISASIAALASEKGEPSPYSEANVRKMEEHFMHVPPTLTSGRSA